MVSYAINREKTRVMVIVLIALIASWVQKVNLTSFLLTSFGINKLSMLSNFSINYMTWVYILYWVYNEFLWKYLCFIHKIPNLNGEWNMLTYRTKKNEEIDTSRTPNYIKGKVEIKQTWDKIEIKTTLTESQTRAIVVSIDENKNLLNYSYGKITGRANDYLGYNSLEINLAKGEISGEYFSSRKEKGIFKISKSEIYEPEIPKP